MKKKTIASLLSACMVCGLLAGCSGNSGDSSTVSGNNADGTSEGSTYTYRSPYSGISTWNPTDWEVTSEYDIIGYTMSEFYGFWMNETKDGYDIVCELASEFPVDVTAQYAGNEVYGVPASATEGYAWQISLRQDAVWEDGTPINADDVEYSLQQYLNPLMKNYRASTFYSGQFALANGLEYYNSDKASGTKMTLATDTGAAFADFTAGEDGQYVDASGNKIYFGWSVLIDNDWMGGDSLVNYSDYFPADTYSALDALANEDGYIPVTAEAVDLLYSFTSSDAWGNEAEEDLINYVFIESSNLKLTLGTDLGIAMSDFSAGANGQYADADGNKAFFGWSVAIDNDWMGNYSLVDYGSYFPEETYYALEALADADGYIPVTDESIGLLYSFTSSDAWGNETEEDLINYVFREDGSVDPVTWENVGYLRNDDYTFTIILKNPCSLFNFEMNIDNLILLNKELYEANKKDAGGLIKSSYGTAVDKYSSYGPYKLVSYQESKSVRLEKNENWYGYHDGEHEGQYQTTAMEWIQLDEHTTQISMFLQGNLDIVGLSADDMETYGTSDYVYYTPDSFYYYFSLNNDFDMLKSRETAGVNKTILTYLDFRKALSLSLDRNDYVKRCTASAEPAFGMLNNVYICEPVTGLAYRDTEYAQKALCDVYGVDDIDDLTGYDKEAAAACLQSAYDQCYADGNISDTDIVEIDYHIYGSDSMYQKMVDFVQDALSAAAEGTSLEGRIKINLVEDQDYYNTMDSGQDDMIMNSWGGGEMDPYSMMICYTDPTMMSEYGFDPYQNLTISVQGEDVTMSYYDWYNELYNGTYAIADLDTRNEILAGMEKGLLLNYQIIPVFSNCSASLYSQRIIMGSEDYINSIVQRGGIRFMTYTMDDAEWAEYCASQNNNLTY